MVLDQSYFRGAVACLALGLMVGCASVPAPPRTVYTTVDRPVPVSCVPEVLGKGPEGFMTPAQIVAIKDGPTRYVALTADWLMRVARMNETEPVIATCRSVGPAP